MARRKYIKVADDDALQLVRETASEVEPVDVPVKRKRKKTTPDVKQEAIKLLNKAFEADEKGIKTLTERVHNGKVSVKAVYEAFKNFEGAVGGRNQLFQVLQHLPPTSVGYGMLTKLMEDPEFLQIAQSEGGEEKVAFALSGLCTKHKIPFPTLVTAFKDARLAKIYIDALNQVTDATPMVVEQMAEDATNRWAPCRACEGSGKKPVIADGGRDYQRDDNGEIIRVLCFDCRGKGSVWEKHDITNRKMFLDFVGINKKEPLINQNFDQRQVNVTTTPGDGFERVMFSLDALTRTKPKQIESQVIDVQPEDNQ